MKEEIIEILKNEILTSSEIANKTRGNKNSIYVILNRLLSDGKIERINDKKPYKYKSIQKYEDTMNNRILHDKIDKLEKYKEGYKQFESLFKTFMENSSKFVKKSQRNILKKLIQENIDIQLIKQINEEMGKK